MSVSIKKATQLFERIGAQGCLDELFMRLRSVREPTDLGMRAETSGIGGTEARRATLAAHAGTSLAALPTANGEEELLPGSIENFIGYTQVPTGVAGPLRVNGSAAKGDYFVPLATTEGALVASYHRGAKATLLSGGITSVCLTEGVKRSPLFRFDNIEASLRFVRWVTQQQAAFPGIVEACTRHGKLQDIQFNVEGNHVIITFEYRTGDAAGQNMVTICTDAICRHLVEHTPIPPRYWYVEGNYSGDKKASAMAMSNVRGKKVTAECVLHQAVLQDVLKTTAEHLAQYWRSSTVSVIQSGSIGAQGHFANGLTALFLATGQDVACVAEAAVGVTRMEVVNNKDLYIAVTLPNLIVGTVGGGTKFPTQQECLRLMDCAGTGTARRYAEICGALLLCGELSIAAALAEGHFTTAHRRLGRGQLSKTGQLE